LLAARDAAEVAPARLLPLMTLWANLHGSFMFGLALALFLGGEAVLRLGPRLRKARQ
jgi:fluoride ion exporter CrcB/FEX